MEVLASAHEGLGLVKKAQELFIEKRTAGANFVDPFMIVPHKRGKQKIMQLAEFSDECVNGNISSLAKKPDFFILAGETVVDNPKTGGTDSFFIVKFYLASAEQGYIYSIPFNSVDGHLEVGDLRYIGSDANVYLNYKAPEGEGSSCNAIKMDPEPPYEYRAAFLIGHMDESRLWIDVNNLIADMYCKLALDTTRKFELIFEVSKFGRMTYSMQTEFDKLKAIFTDSFACHFPNIKSDLQLENTRLS